MIPDEAWLQHWLDENHPLQYEVEPGEAYNHCPTCDEWSPCTVRELSQNRAELQRVKGHLDTAREVLDDASVLLMTAQFKTDRFREIRDEIVQRATSVGTDGQK